MPTFDRETAAGGYVGTYLDLSHLNLTLAITGGIVLLLGLVGGYIRNTFWISEPIVATLVGIALGPALLGIMPGIHPSTHPGAFMHELARLTLALAVMSAAIRLPMTYISDNWRSLTIVIGGGMIVMWLIGSILAAFCFSFGWMAALLVGAVVSPTDPVLAGVVTSGSIAERNIPGRIRHLLCAESGLNDGLAMVVVALPMILMQHADAAALSDWAIEIVLWEVIGGIVVGAAIGWVAMHLLKWSRRRALSETHSTLTIGIALAVTTLAVVRLMGSDGILAAFVAGAFLNRAIDDSERIHEHIQEAIGRFFILPIFLVFGAALPWQQWFSMGWPVLVFALAVLCLRRMPLFLLLGKIVPDIHTRRETLFAGWFGPMGISSLFYATLAVQETGFEQVWPITALVVLASVVAHGITAMPLVRRISTDMCEET
ncbi:cation:proton antiporter [Pararhizobium mangrovi]|uniref:cation:proton antiporter n=1 Tax=Pararhizobium mangrovi TaxID=2590452 RepID=UPI0015E861D0|nr:cation:proton antiporter [Pararhizobium mangrovi]